MNLDSPTSSLNLLGTPSLIVDGADVPIGRRASELLVRLGLAAGRPVRTASLVDELFPQPGCGTDALHAVISRLRRAVDRITTRGRGAQIVRTTPAGYSIGLEPDAIDVHRFERLHRRAHDHRSNAEPNSAAALFRDALDLWSGEPFGGIDLDDRLRAVEVRLWEVWADAAEHLAGLSHEAGRYGDAINTALPVCDVYPLREGAVAVVMRARYHAGDQVGALRTFAEYRRRLADETGLDPSRSLTELEQDVLMSSLDCCDRTG